MGRLRKKIGGLSRNRLKEGRCGIICEGLAHRNSYCITPSVYREEAGLTSSKPPVGIRSMNSVDLGISGRGRLRAPGPPFCSAPQIENETPQPGSVLSAVTVSA
jgi:hypothetical protein